MLILEEDDVEVGIAPVFAGVDDKRPNRSAIFTIVRDDEFLETWLANNRELFTDAYVLFHQDEIRTHDYELCQRWNTTLLRIYNDETCSWSWITDTINKFSAWLLNSHQFVAYTDVDEIIVDPRDRLKNFDKLPDFVRFVGLDIIQGDDEPPLNWQAPIKDQRQFAYCSTNACKVVAKKRATYQWDSGQHKLLSEPYDVLYGPIKEVPNLNPHIYLVHLHYFDMHSALLRSSARKNVAKFEQANNLGVQGWAKDLEDVKASFARRRVESRLLVDRRCSTFVLRDDPFDIIDRIQYLCSR
jgi:hypothetical protein